MAPAADLTDPSWTKTPFPPSVRRALWEGSGLRWGSHAEIPDRVAASLVSSGGTTFGDATRTGRFSAVEAPSLGGVVPSGIAAVSPTSALVGRGPAET